MACDMTRSAHFEVPAFAGVGGDTKVGFGSEFDGGIFNGLCRVLALTEGVEIGVSLHPVWPVEIHSLHIFIKLCFKSSQR